MVQRQAIVVVHGMGEQKPGDALRPFSEMVIGQGTEYFSRPTLVGDSFEARFHHVPSTTSEGEPNGDFGAETDIYEYHWSYRMKDNRLKDLGSVGFRTLLPTRRWWHLIGVALLLVAAGLVASVVVGAWSPPQSLRGIASWFGKAAPFAGSGFYLDLWPIGDVDFWRIGFVLLAAIALGGVVVYLKRNSTRSRVPLFVGVVFWVTIATCLALNQWPYVNGELLAFALFATALGTMFPLTPTGLKATWAIVWLLAASVVFTVMLPNWNEIVAASTEPATIPKLLLGGAGALILTQVLGRVAPWLTTSFVDVVRYVDTSPRSYEVRRDIREGFVELLTQLHERGEADGYDRIVVCAHSLGSYIAYDALTTLWFQRTIGVDLDIPSAPDVVSPDLYRDQQADAFADVSSETIGGSPVWRVSHLLTFGSPMYLADRLLTKTTSAFRVRLASHDLPTCPPPNDVTLVQAAFDAEAPTIARKEVAVFGVVQWVNVWYPATIGLFGDPFGGPLARLYGPGIEDRRVRDGLSSWLPYVAHASYTRSTGTAPTSFAGAVLRVLGVDAGEEDDP